MKLFKKIDGAIKISKAEQRNQNGGTVRSQDCPTLCTQPGATSGQPCGYPHCPGVCTGNGGWVYY